MDSAKLLAREGDAKHAATIALHAGFVVAGVIASLLGPVLPMLIARWSLSDERAGLFFTAQFCGSMAGVASVSVLIPWRGYKLPHVIGFTFMAIGVALLNMGSESAGLFAAALFGYGLGLIIAATNLWIAEVAGARRGAALSILNLAWGIGAVACPPLVMFAQLRHGVPALLFGIAGISLVIALILVAVHTEPHSGRNGGALTSVAYPTVSKQTALALGLLFFLYVGSESSIGGWIAAFAKRMGTVRGNQWTLAPMFFWAGLIAGRALVPAMLSRIRENKLMAFGLLLAGIGDAALLEMRTFRGMVGCAVLIGLGFANIYPLLVACLVRSFGDRAKSVGSAMFALAALGGASMPWLVGVASTKLGGLHAGLLVPLAGCLAMIGLLRLLD
jgi:fucose permease